MFRWYIGDKSRDQSAIFVDYRLHYFCTILYLCNFPKKIRPKIGASFCTVSSVISLKQRTKIRRKFETRTKIPYQRNNSASRMRNIVVDWADQYRTNNVPFFWENNRGHVDALLLAVVNVLFCISLRRISILWSYSVTQTRKLKLCHVNVPARQVQKSDR